MSLKLVVLGATALFARADHCEVFCPKLATTCTGNNTQFESTELCISTCKSWDRTVLDGAYYGDTFDCRDKHLTTASESEEQATIHCSHAGPTGGGRCVDTDRCTNFCKTFVDVTCSEDVEFTAEYASIDKCKQTCQGYKTTALHGALSGDTYQCRETYLGRAYLVLGENLVSHEVECGRAKKTSTMCTDSVTRCQTFCELFELTCNDVATPYDNCEEQCEKFSTAGKDGDKKGNSLQCRETFLGTATKSRGNGASLALDCPNAALDGGLACVGAIPGDGDGSGAQVATVALAVVAFPVLL